MNSNSNNGPLIKAAGLWQKTSVKGGQYLTGRMGGLRACLTRSSSHTVVSRSIILSKTFVRVLDPVCRAGSHTRLKIM
jgi:hypothetical protein